jgi:DNA polymerase-3 subunit alpha
LFAAVEGAMEVGQRAWRDRASGQGGLFGGLDEGADDPDPMLPTVPEWTPREMLSGEKEMLGYYVTGHPLDHYQDKISELATHHTGNLEGLTKNTEVAVCGVLTGITKKRNKDQKPWAAMQLEDKNGAVEMMVFTTQYERLAPEIVEDQAVMVRGLVLPEESAPPKISAQDIVPLDKAAVRLPSLISIRVWLGRNGTADKAQALQELFERKQGGTQVRLRLEQAREFSVILDVPAKVRPDKEFRAHIEKICGQDAIEELAG